MWGDIKGEARSKAAFGTVFLNLTLINEYNIQYHFVQIWKSHERAVEALAVSRTTLLIHEQSQILE